MSGVPLLLHPQQNNKNCVSVLVDGDDCESDVVDDCTIPSFVDVVYTSGKLHCVSPVI